MFTTCFGVNYFVLSVKDSIVFNHVGKEHVIVSYKVSYLKLPVCFQVDLHVHETKVISKYDPCKLH